MRELASLLDPVVTGAGLVLEGVKTTRAGKRSVVEVTVDLPDEAIGSITLDEISAAVPAIAAALDDAIPGPYALEVTSPGTSRPLTTARHFKRARTRLVTVQLTDGSSRSGRVVAADDEVVTLRMEEGTGAKRAKSGKGAKGTDLTHDNGQPSDTVQIALTDIVSGRIDVELNRRDELSAGE